MMIAPHLKAFNLNRNSCLLVPISTSSIYAKMHSWIPVTTNVAVNCLATSLRYVLRMVASVNCLHYVIHRHDDVMFMQLGNR